MADTLRNIGRGLARGMTADALGTPVDTLNQVRAGLLGPATAGNPYATAIRGLLGPEQQMGTGDWFAQQMGLPQGQGVAYEAARMLAPSPTEVVGLLRRTPIEELITYHGTPHTFEPTPDNPLGEFRASQIGTGEGAQMYGHGIYLAENEPTARYYAESVSSQHGQKLVDKAGNEISFPNPDAEGLAEVYLKGSSGYSEAKKQLLELAKDSEYADGYMQAIDALNKWESQGIRIGKQKEPVVYTADLPDEMVDQMLDWDKPISKQPEAVQKVIFDDIDLAIAETQKSLSTASDRRAPATAKDLEKLKRERDRIANLTGGAYYQQQSLGVTSGRPSASEALRQLGIPGIKYLDAISRGDKAKPTRNFVLFPGEEKKAKIIKRE